MISMKKQALCSWPLRHAAARYVHDNIYDAQNEALRLCEAHDCTVTILEIIGTVEKRKVPVTHVVPIISLNKYAPGERDDLPF